jgi:arsenate reductase
MPLPKGDKNLVLLHNPRCSKSRAAKELLEARGVAFETRLYLEDPLSRAELAELRKRLERPCREWVRRGEDEFKAAKLSADSDDKTLLDAIAKYPVLLERPILVSGSRAAVGMPTENLLALLPRAAKSKS